jgi:hypothetical protein
MKSSMANSSASVNSTSANFSGVNATLAGVPTFVCQRTGHNHRAANTIGAHTHASKINDLPLFATVGALTAAWLVAVVGLALTIKGEYLHTFISLQTGSDLVQSHFRDNEGNDARRVFIFFNNTRKWRTIRDLVRQWVLSMYVAWKALMPAWFTTGLQARIPDDFMPVEVLHDLNAQAPDGRRPTMQNMGLLRRVSHAAALDVTPDSERGVRRLSELLNLPSTTDERLAFPTSSASESIFHGPSSTEPTTSVATAIPAAVSAARRFHIADDVRLWEITGEAPDSRKPDKWPNVADEEYQTMPEEV